MFDEIDWKAPRSVQVLLSRLRPGYAGLDNNALIVAALNGGQVPIRGKRGVLHPFERIEGRLDERSIRDPSIFLGLVWLGREAYEEVEVDWIRLRQYISQNLLRAGEELSEPEVAPDGLTRLPSDTPAEYVARMRSRSVPPEEIATLVDEHWPGMTDAELGFLLPTTEGHPPSEYGQRKRGQRLRGKVK